MRPVLRLFFVGGLFLGLSAAVSASDDDGTSPIFADNARASISGAPGSGVSGEAYFIQMGEGIQPTVWLLIIVQGLAPDTVHGVHLHENGSCTDTAVPFGGAGGHHDPGPSGLSDPDANHPYHMGDLPNLEANSEGVAVLTRFTNRVTLTPGPLTLFDANGSAIIVHANPDQGVTGPTGSGMSGGPRIACGVIE